MGRLPLVQGARLAMRPRPRDESAATWQHRISLFLSRAPQTLAFIFAVPVAMAMFGLKREWEALGQPVATVLV